MWLGFFLLYLRQNIKPYMTYRLGLRLELENSEKKQSAQASIDQALQIYRINPAVYSIPTLHKNTL